jgi:hypothetical protein
VTATAEKKTSAEWDAEVATLRAIYEEQTARAARRPVELLELAMVQLEAERARDELVLSGGRVAREDREALADRGEELIALDSLVRTAPPGLRELSLKITALERRAAEARWREDQAALEKLAFRLGRGPVADQAKASLAEANAIARETMRRGELIGLGGRGSQALREHLDGKSLTLPTAPFDTYRDLVRWIVGTSRLFRLFTMNGDGGAR